VILGGRNGELMWKQEGGLVFKVFKDINELFLVFQQGCPPLSLPAAWVSSILIKIFEASFYK